MEPEVPSPPPEAPEQPALEPAAAGTPEAQPPALLLPPEPQRGVKWVFLGPHGLRAGWSVLIFILIFALAGNGLGWLFTRMHLLTKGGAGLTPRQGFYGELFQFIALLIAGLLTALIERRSLLDYNLRGPHRVLHFIAGGIAGLAALTVLVGAMAAGGWLHFNGMALTGVSIWRYAAIWAVVFALVGCVEEGLMRCYLLATLARGLNFWISSGVVLAVCVLLLFVVKGGGNGAWGVYAMALLGVAPCLLLHLNKRPSSGFWQAAWLTSVLFGFAHTGNNGENWIGIFAAGFIGFAFCVSVYVTGSAWWAIGCHAAWDWGETYFYGTPDSGFVSPGHLLKTTISGNPLWSGGTDGPEGSVLVIGIVALLIVALVAIYGRRHSSPLIVPAGEQLAG